MRILIVEDQISLLNIIRDRLRSEGYGVDTCVDGQSALEHILEFSYDAIVLDILLPKMNGLEVLKKAREQGISTPVLLLTAKSSVQDRVAGLDIGADDYLTKPFSFDELLARVRALLRRQPVDSVSSVLSIADLTVNLNEHTVMRANCEIQLSQKEFAILEYLMRNKNIVLSRTKIEEHVWSYGFDGASNVVDVYIRYLRKKIDAPFEKKLIHTLRGVGYVIKEQAE